MSRNESSHVPNGARAPATELSITTVIIRTLLSQTPLFGRSRHIPTLAEILEMTGDAMLSVCPSAFISCSAMLMPSVRVYRSDKFGRG